MVNEYLGIKGKREEELHNELQSFITSLYSNTSITPRLAADISFFKRVKFGGEVFASSLWRKGNEETVLVRGPLSNGTSRLCPVRVLYYIQASVITSHPHVIIPTVVIHKFAKCRFHPCHSRQSTVFSSVWQRSTVEDDVIIPLGRLCCSALLAPVPDHEDQVMVLMKPNLLIAWNPGLDSTATSDDVTEEEDEEMVFEEVWW